MKTLKLTALSVALAGGLVLAGCSSTPESFPELTAAQQSLEALQQDDTLAKAAPVAVADAERAVRNAHQAVQDGRDVQDVNNLVYLAKNKIELARTEAERAVSERRARELARQRDQVVLDARTRQAEAAQAEAQFLRDQLSAKQTERGNVITLGDVLFTTGQADLKPGARNNLDKLVTYLRQYEDRTVTVEGHTDSTGSRALNERLSQRRADAVRLYLVERGIASSRINAVGKGQDYPIASNGSPEGRQQNRRVEIIIAD